MTQTVLDLLALYAGIHLLVATYMIDARGLLNVLGFKAVPGITGVALMFFASIRLGLLPTAL